MNTAPCKILVVDDEAIPRMLLRTNLAEAGYIVQDADSGKKALQLLREEPFDVVLLDLIIPEQHLLQQL